MRVVLIAVVVLLAVPALAQAPSTLVVVEKEPLQKRLGSVNQKLSEAIGRTKDKKLQELLKAARAELTDASDQVAGAPESKMAEEGQRAAINMAGGMMGSTMGLIQGQMEADRRERERGNTTTTRQEVVVVHKYEGAPPPPPPPAAVVPSVQPISDASLRSLMAAIQEESFAKEQLTVLGQAAPSQYFVVPQVQQILAQFDFASDRLEAMRILKPRILDLRENGFQLYSSFEFSPDKEQLKRILAQ